MPPRCTQIGRSNKLLYWDQSDRLSQVVQVAVPTAPWGLMDRSCWETFGYGTVENRVLWALMKVSIITTAEHSALLQSVLAQINAVQDSWIFEVRENILTIFKKNEEVDAYSVREYISSNKQLFVRPVVFITHLRLEDNWFSHDFAEVSNISTH